MPRGSSAAPGWFVKGINEVIEGLERVAAYLDDIIVDDADPAAHTANIRDRFERLRQHSLNLPPAKAKKLAPPKPTSWGTRSTPLALALTPARSLPQQKCQCRQT